MNKEKINQRLWQREYIHDLQEGSSEKKACQRATEWINDPNNRMKPHHKEKYDTYKNNTIRAWQREANEFLIKGVALQILQEILEYKQQAMEQEVTELQETISTQNPSYEIPFCGIMLISRDEEYQTPEGILYRFTFNGSHPNAPTWRNYGSWIFRVRQYFDVPPNAFSVLGKPNTLEFIGYSIEEIEKAFIHASDEMNMGFTNTARGWHYHDQV